MDRIIEEAFVNGYIASKKRERLLFELQGNKRIHGVGRFCHCADDFIIQSTIKMRGQYITDELKKWIAKSKGDRCYIISFFESLDGKFIDKDKALDVILGAGMPSIAIFDDFVIIETEQEQGPAIKYLLQK